MSCCFRSADILLPKGNFEKWSVIACDQYTSDRGYWQNIRKNIGDAPSTLHMILPEAELQQLSDGRIADINHTMDKYLRDGTLQTYPASFAYVERVLLDGSVRQGVVGVIDLERYDINPKENTLVFATEGTVAERLPPRIRIRRDAAMELSHTVIFCDDTCGTLIEELGRQKGKMPKLYGLELMCGGGQIDGWLVDGDAAEAFEKAVEQYEKDHIYLVGDGNHSLLTAKKCYELLKQTLPKGEWENTPARYAMVELENIHSPAMQFEPIHRVIENTNPDALLADLRRISADGGTPVTVITKDGRVQISLPVSQNELTVGVLQDFLDKWLKEHDGSIDYIHGKDVAEDLAKRDGSVAILLPDIDKGMLFPYIRSGKITPRKTFSIGHASEKRYYMEGRRIR